MLNFSFYKELAESVETFVFLYHLHRNTPNELQDETAGQTSEFVFAWQRKLESWKATKCFPNLNWSE